MNKIKYCEVCGEPLSRFENPERYLCRKIADHSAMEVMGKRERIGTVHSE